MTTFYLCRHAEKSATWSGADPGLSPLGLAQARWTACSLADLPIRALYSSPLRRAETTARQLATTLRVPLHVTAALRERANYGDDPSQTWEGFQSMWDYATRHRAWQPPLGESSYAAGERLDQFLVTLSDANPDASFMLVTHGGLIGDFVRNRFTEDDWRPFTNDLCTVPHCSLTTITRVEGRYQLAAYGKVAYLPKL